MFLNVFDKNLKKCRGKEDSLPKELAEECLCEGLINEKKTAFGGGAFDSSVFESKFKS